MDDPLISVIMPVYNGSLYIRDAISSLLDQEYTNWELLIVNDGSTDNSQEIISSFSDYRIHSFEFLQNKGVSAARNYALSKMKGEFYCFLDADDMFTYNGLSARSRILQNRIDLTFVDGAVEKWDSNMELMLNSWTPDFNGNPLSDLISLSGKSFFGPTWMIRRSKYKQIFFDEELSHGEDLMFYMDLARDQSKKYGFTPDTVLKYRVHRESAMNDLVKIETCYKKIKNKIDHWLEINDVERRIFDRRVRRIMFLSYLNARRPLKAIKSIL